MDRPFREIPGERHEVDMSEAVVAGGVVILAAAIPHPDGQMPALIFKFARADGSGFATPVVLALHDDAMVAALPELVTSAIAAAMNATG